MSNTFADLLPFHLHIRPLLLSLPKNDCQYSFPVGVYIPCQCLNRTGLSPTRIRSTQRRSSKPLSNFA
ncbi:hypothetical protein I7I53_06078 [Histoplasma capsulatum var. duboisii H88]|uniref:Uncharacterized protein n=1 Tax=Ajellomyces capsulatus (strain H88) TaxID=544711 RepID=A0A8A1LAA9_AJEC8|nr:hypothetical protein I7I53_06078 [Histoplasma capsulatum var. duboisii H88]